MPREIQTVKQMTPRAKSAKCECGASSSIGKDSTRSVKAWAIEHVKIVHDGKIEETTFMVTEWSDWG